MQLCLIHRFNAKGKPDVGETVNKTLQKFLDANKLNGALPEVKLVKFF